MGYSEVSEVPTPYAVHCRGIDPEIGLGPCHKGPIYLTKEGYDRQMRQTNKTWRCPICNGDASWDDDIYEKSITRNA